MSYKSIFSKKGFLFVYFAIWSSLIITAAIWLTVFLVGTLRNPAKITEPENTEVFDSILALTDKKVVRYLGEWEFLEPELPGHFHHIGRWYQSDKWNFCIECHGPIPHSRNVKERAFLNMHNLFISCQVCHVQETEGITPTRFGWIDMNNGTLKPNPEMTEGVWGEYSVKIIQLKDSEDNSQPLKLEEEKGFAGEFRKNMNNLNDSQKVIGNKFIHRKCIENPVTCSDCHNIEKQFLPFTDLGYSKERADFLVSSEVVDMVKRYETFLIPNILKPKQPEQNTVEEKP
jgi:hypothetical protein